MELAALYCRLSKEDVDKQDSEDESESIVNQKMLLVDYAIEHGFTIYKIYVDDDYSGLYDTRPGFERMIEDAKQQKFNILIAKSQSRFSRNMSHIEKYLHNEFPLLGIRFIGVVDGVDTDVKGNKKARQINGLLNEWYCEDLSDNIRAVFRKKMEAGQFLGSFAPFGYRKDPEDHHKLIIDPEAAEIVKMIFDLCVRGYGTAVIAEKLTEMNIMTPTMYKQNKGLSYKTPNTIYSNNGIWATTTVKRILSNDVYCGTLIQGREKKVSYKSKKVVIAPKDNWVIIKDNHEAIIPEELFDEVQDLLKSRGSSFNIEKGTPHIFAGKLKCKDCGGTIYKTSGGKRASTYYLACQRYAKTKGKECSRHSLRYDVLLDYVSKQVAGLIEGAIKSAGGLDKISDSLKLDSKRESRIQSLQLLINKQENNIDTLDKALSQSYIDKIKGVITEDMFYKFSENYREQRSKLKELIDQEGKKLDKLYRDSKTSKSFEDIVREYIINKSLDRNVVLAFIDYIEIGESDSVKDTQTIDIHWNI